MISRATVLIGVVVLCLVLWAIIIVEAVRVL